MKKIHILFIAAVCLLLSACGNQLSNEEIKKTKIEPIRIANINNKLYYETDQESDIEARCGVMDGNFEKNVDRFVLPKHNGEVNFGEVEGYQIGTEENTIEIPIDGDWEIFKMLDTNSDILKYKYCYVVEGTLPNAQEDSNFLVLADTLDITFEEAANQLFGSNTEQMKDAYVLPIVDESRY